MDGHLRVDRRAKCLLGLHRPPKARAQRQKERPSGAKRNINHCTGGIQNTAHRPKPMWDLIAHDKGGTLNENATTKNQESINPKHSTQNLLPNKDYRLFFYISDQDEKEKIINCLTCSAAPSKHSLLKRKADIQIYGKLRFNIHLIDFLFKYSQYFTTMQ